MFVLAHLLDWAQSNDVDLDNASIGITTFNTYNGERMDPSIHVTFQSKSETSNNLRSLKRAMGKLEAGGSPPYVHLRGTTLLNPQAVEHEDEPPMTLSVRVEGAFECEYTCKPSKPGVGRLMNELSDGVVPETFTEDSYKTAIAEAKELSKEG